MKLRTVGVTRPLMAAACLLSSAATVLPGRVHAQDGGIVTTFVGTPEDVFHDVIATSGGGVVAVGYTTRAGAGGRDILLIKAERCGGVVWRKTLGGSGNEEGWSVIELPGGDLAIAGHTSSIGGPGDHLLVSRLNALGAEVWTRVLTDPDGNPQLRGYDLMRDSSGDLVVTGTAWDSALIYSVLLAKFASNGSFVGAAAYREALAVNWDLWGESVVEACDGDYLVVGGALYNVTDSRWVLMARIRPSLLIVEWSRFLQESGTDAVGHGATMTSDGELALTGETGGHLFVSKRECDGTPVANWQKKLAGSSEGHNMAQTSGNGIVVAGGLGTHVFVGSWTSAGSVTWARGWGAGMAYGVTEDAQDRIWVAGANGTDGLLGKLDPSGRSCYGLHYNTSVIDWNPTEDVRNLTWHALSSLEVWGWSVDTANVSLQQGSDGCDHEGDLCDMNCDGIVTFDDIDAFVLALTGYDPYHAEYSDCCWSNADCNGDGYVNFNDIDCFVACLAGDCP